MTTDSILTSVKKCLSGIPADNTEFDKDIIYSINSWFSALSQMGVGPRAGFTIMSASTTWGDYSDDEFLNSMVSEYIVLKTKLTFDPPQSNSTMECAKELVAEYEWRLNVYAESGN